MYIINIYFIFIYLYMIIEKFLITIKTLYV